MEYKYFQFASPFNSNRLITTIDDVDTTAWGRVPTNFSIVEAFDNDPSSRGVNLLNIGAIKMLYIGWIIKLNDTRSIHAKNQA